MDENSLVAVKKSVQNSRIRQTRPREQYRREKKSISIIKFHSSTKCRAKNLKKEQKLCLCARRKFIKVIKRPSLG